METNNINKRSYEEFEKDFLEFQEVKNKFLEKYLKIIAGVKVDHYRTKKAMITEIEIVFDAEAKQELYE